MILDRYITKNLYIYIFITLLVLLGVDVLFYLVNELRYVGKGSYNIITAIEFIILTIPRKLYLLFPWAALIGAILALGKLAKNSELIVMQVSGCARRQITFMALKATLFLSLGIFLLGETFVPYSEKIAQNFKTMAISLGSAVNTQYGTWIRNAEGFVKINFIDTEKKLYQISWYQIANNRLTKAILIDVANYSADNKTWELSGIKGTEFKLDATEAFAADKILIKDFLNLDILEAAKVKHLERLNLISLAKLIKSRKQSNLDYKDYALAYWMKFIHPLTILVMVYLALPFVFGPLRDKGFGQRLLTGIGIGLMFYAVNSIFVPFMTVFNLAPIIAAVAPSVIFLGIGMVLL